MTKQFRRYNELRRVRNNFATTMKQWREEYTQGTPQDNLFEGNSDDESHHAPRYLIRRFADGTPYIQASRKVIKGNNPNAWLTQMTKYLEDEVGDIRVQNESDYDWIDIDDHTRYEQPLLLLIFVFLFYLIYHFLDHLCK